MNVVDIQSSPTMINNNDTVFTYINTGGYSLSEYHHIKQLLDRNLHREQRLRQLERRGKFRRLVHQVVGGLPLKGYALTLKITYVLQFDPFADESQHFTYKYKSKTSSVKEDAIDDAIQQFLKDKNKNTSAPNSFECGDAMYVNHEVISHKEFPGTKLSALPLYGLTLADKCCPDDDKIHATPGQCVIDGLYSMLKPQHFKSITTRRLIQEIGTKTPSVDDLKRWLTSEDYSYHKYVSMCVLDPLNRKLFRYKAPDSRMVITAKVNNQHFYVITQTALQDQIKHHECLDLN
jgi:hypothetical protein